MRLREWEGKRGRGSVCVCVYVCVCVCVYVAKRGRLNSLNHFNSIYFLTSALKGTTVLSLNSSHLSVDLSVYSI